MSRTLCVPTRGGGSWWSGPALCSSGTTAGALDSEQSSETEKGAVLHTGDGGEVRLLSGEAQTGSGLFRGGEDPGLKACCSDMGLDLACCQRRAFDSCWKSAKPSRECRAITLGAARGLPVLLLRAGTHERTLQVWVPWCVYIALLTPGSEPGCLGLNRACVRCSNVGSTAMAFQ